MQPQTRNALFASLLALTLSACAVYSPEIRQGNFIEDAKLAQVKAGMTREQVRFLLGPPMIADAFHAAQWDYFFQLENEYLLKGGSVRRHYAVHFDGDYVTEIVELD